MAEPYEALIEERIDIDAPDEVVWPLIVDVRRMAQFSPQVDSCDYDEEGAVGVGTRFTNHNSHAELRWTTHGEIVRLVPRRSIAFRIDENFVVWEFQLTQRPAGGVTLTQRRTTRDGISESSLRLTDTYLGGQAAFTQTMRAGMRHTLLAVKAAAEAATPATTPPG